MVSDCTVYDKNKRHTSEAVQSMYLEGMHHPPSLPVGLHTVHGRSLQCPGIHWLHAIVLNFLVTLVMCASLLLLLQICTSPRANCLERTLFFNQSFRLETDCMTLALQTPGLLNLSMPFSHRNVA